MKSELNILILGCEPSLASLVRSAFGQSGAYRCRLHECDQWHDGLYSLCPDLTVIRCCADRTLCLSRVRKLKIIDPLMPVLIVADHEEARDGRPPFEGVHSIPVPTGAEILVQTLETALKKREEAEVQSDLPILVGKSRQLIEIRKRIERVSDKDITVLVTGETGTGKELVARSIHYFSHRKNGPLVKISCGNLPSELLESEVFGFQKGAFTDAHRNKPGRLELADRGTLFLDEIGNLALPLQVKFLQILEDKAFVRLGGTEDRAINTRVVAATNSDLRRLVREGGFREDLFYRLNVLHINVPPLRERPEDIPPLVEYFLNRYCLALKRNRPDTPKEVSDLFTAYHWPGNVRELENLVRRAIVLQNWGFLREEIRLRGGEAGSPVPVLSGNGRSVPGVDEQVAGFLGKGDRSLKEIAHAYVREAERAAILEALERTRWNKQKAAALLGAGYKTLCNRVKELDLHPPGMGPAREAEGK